MFTKSITFTSYDNETLTEEFSFNLNRAEILRMNYTSEEAFQKKLQRMVDERDTRKLYKMFEDVVQMAVGKKSVDGRRFEKSDAIVQDFMQTEAYSEFIVWLLSDAENATAFIDGILPKSEEDLPDVSTSNNTETENKVVATVV